MFNRKKQEKEMEVVSGVINRIGAHVHGYNGSTDTSYTIILQGNQNIFHITPQDECISARLSMPKSGDLLRFKAHVARSLNLIEITGHGSIEFDTIITELSNS